MLRVDRMHGLKVLNSGCKYHHYMVFHQNLLWWMQKDVLRWKSSVFRFSDHHLGIAWSFNTTNTPPYWSCAFSHQPLIIWCHHRANTMLTNKGKTWWWMAAAPLFGLGPFAEHWTHNCFPCSSSYVGRRRSLGQRNQPDSWSPISPAHSIVW